MQTFNDQIFCWVTHLMIVIPLIFFLGDYTLYQHHSKQCVQENQQIISAKHCLNSEDFTLPYHEKNWQKALIVEVLIVFAIFMKIIHRRRKQQI